MIINPFTLLIRISYVLTLFLCLIGFLYLPGLVSTITNQRTISVLAWPVSLDRTFISEFEEKTGIKVHLTFFEDNEQLFVKLQSGAGSGYDLIMPADYGADLLIKAGLVKKLDHSKLNFMDKIYPELYNLYFDPQMNYTIPFCWSVFGIGIDRRVIKDKNLFKPTWRSIFEPRNPPIHIAMLDDARELISIAAFYLQIKSQELTREEINKIKNLLQRQKKWVVAYTDLRSDYLLISQTVPAALALSGDIYRAAEKHDYIDFLIPEEGSFAVIDTFAIPITSQKDELIYEFLNYLYQEKVIESYQNIFGFMPVLITMQPMATHMPTITPANPIFSSLRFFTNTIPEHILNDIWISLKSS